jgi:antitoxin MazE
MMKTQFVKWGNSLALRVPSAFADEVGATEGKRAVMTVENGALVVKVVERPRKQRRRYSLEQLLAGLSREDEIDWGQPRGREVR